MVLQTAYKYK